MQFESNKVGFSIGELLQASAGNIRAAVKRYLDGEYSPVLSHDDLVQEISLEVIKDFDQFRGSTLASYGSWLQCVCRNTCYNALERDRAQKRYSGRNFMLEDEITCSASPSVDRHVEGRETLEAVMELAAGMGQNYESVIRMLSEGNTSQEISDELGISIQGVYGIVKWFRVEADRHPELLNRQPAYA